MLTLGSHPWSGFGHLLKGAYLSYVTVSKGPKAPKDAKQSKIFAATASVSCQKAFINLKIIISLVSQKVEIYANYC